MSSAFRVSICGGGVGGMILAIVMAKYGTLPVEIFEAGSTINTSGAGLTFFGRAMDIMSELGLYDEIVKIAVRPPQKDAGPTFRKSDRPDGHYWFTKRLARGDISVHREDLVNCLLRRMPPSCKIHTSKRLELYEVDSKTGTITMYFSDGSTAVTDVLVGADGIHSVTRKIMYQNFASLVDNDGAKQRLLKYIDPVWTGIIMYRNLIPTKMFVEEHPDLDISPGLTIYHGKNKHIIAYPISQGRLINVVIYVRSDAIGAPFDGRWTRHASEKEILDHFEGWELRARAVVKSTEWLSRWALHSLQPLPYYVDGSVVLMGDSAHAMQPHFAAGTGQAMEDAFVLGRLLTHPLTTRKNVKDALKVYEQVRLPFANRVVQRSGEIVNIYYGPYRNPTDPLVVDRDSPEELDRLRKRVEDAWEWQNEPVFTTWVEAEERWRNKCRPLAKL